MPRPLVRNALSPCLKDLVAVEDSSDAEEGVEQGNEFAGEGVVGVLGGVQQGDGERAEEQSDSEGVQQRSLGGEVDFRFCLGVFEC